MPLFKAEISMEKSRAGKTSEYLYDLERSITVGSNASKKSAICVLALVIKVGVNVGFERKVNQ